MLGIVLGSGELEMNHSSYPKGTYSKRKLQLFIHSCVRDLLYVDSVFPKHGVYRPIEMIVLVTQKEVGEMVAAAEEQV